MKKRFLFVTVLYFLIANVLSAQQLLTNINASWSNVLPGKIVSKPEIADFGFGVMTDAKNLMAFTNEGKLIWEKNFFRFYSPFFSFLPGDFALIITNNGQRMTLLNPDGNELWQKDLNYKIIDKAFPGRDGRFFVRSEESIHCYTITGLEKWTIETPSQNNLPIQELTDGSIVVFLDKLENYKTKALRITPFGEIIEEITFAGEITTSLTTPEGILLTFTDGTNGLFDLEENKAQHKWLLKKDKQTKNNLDFFVLSQNKKDVIYINHHSSNIEIDYLNTKDGTIEKSFFVQNINPSPTCYYNDSGVLLIDSESTYFYNNTGKLLWSGKLPPKSAREYYTKNTFTTDNHLILFGSNWSINAFRTSQSASNKNKKNNQKDDSYNYNSFYKFDASLFNNLYSVKLDKDLSNEAKLRSLKEGFYGADEIKWVSELLGNCTMYINFLGTSNTGTRVDKSVFEQDSVGLEQMLSQLSLYQTSVFNNLIISCLKKETNRSLLHALISSIANNGYDPDQELLKALCNFGKNLNPKDELLLQDVCDGVYSICKLMGTKAFNAYGKQFYTELMYPKYNSKTRDYAREKLTLLVNKK